MTCLHLFILCWLSAQLCLAQTGDSSLYLLRGNQTHLKKSGSVWVEDGSVIKIISAGASLTLQGLKSGTSRMQVGQEEFTIQVLELSDFRAYKKLFPQIPKYLGLWSQIENGRFVIHGNLLSWEDWLSLHNTCEVENCSYELQAHINPSLQLRAKKEIANLLKQKHLPMPLIHWGQKPIASMNAKNGFFTALQKQLGTWGIRLENDNQGLNIEPLVRVQIHLAEVKRDFFRQYGLQWNSTYQSQFLNKELSKELTLLALENQGQGRILASPNLLCRSGQEAEFLAGGEFPIKILTPHVQDVIWKKYGVLLKIKPKADLSGSMSISIETEVSTIDDSRKVDGIPGLLTHRVQSHFDLSEPRTIALSGLIKQESGKSTSGLPGLSSIPILGALFGSRDFRENRSELVILVRPEIVDLNQEADTMAPDSSSSSVSTPSPLPPPSKPATPELTPFDKDGF